MITYSIIEWLFIHDLIWVKFGKRVLKWWEGRSVFSFPNNLKVDRHLMTSAVKAPANLKAIWTFYYLILLDLGFVTCCNKTSYWIRKTLQTTWSKKFISEWKQSQRKITGKNWEMYKTLVSAWHQYKISLHYTKLTHWTLRWGPGDRFTIEKVSSLLAS